MVRKILLVLLALLVIIQFVQPERNLSGENTHDITSRYVMPERVGKLLQVACTDCHSNKTEYPWYASAQPIAWWLNGHVRDGKRHLNFSAFTHRPVAYQNHKFEEIVEVMKEKEMPLASYTWLGLHAGANLSDEDAELIASWAAAHMDTLKQQYPADSLVWPRKR